MMVSAYSKNKRFQIVPKGDALKPAPIVFDGDIEIPAPLETTIPEGIVVSMAEPLDYEILPDPDVELEAELEVSTCQED